MPFARMEPPDDLADDREAAPASPVSAQYVMGRAALGGARGVRLREGGSAAHMNYISLFSGIEAASVAWAPLDWNPVAFAEIDPFCCAVLRHHYPTTPNVGDVTAVNWQDYHGQADVVVGGPPCQSFSLAGLRYSLEDSR